MPELPEVETVRQTILPDVKGRRIDAVEILTPEVFLSNEFVVTGCLIQNVRRRGKYLLIDLLDYSDNKVKKPLIMLVHLRMTGRLLLRQQDLEPPKHTHLRFRLIDPERSDDVIWLDFHDTRRFGRVWIRAADDAGQPVGAPSGYDALGPEPFDTAFSAAYLQNRQQQKRNVSLKAFLLDQSVVAGLGNIYVDESLFAAKLTPDRTVGSLSECEFDRITVAVRQVLEQAILCQGTSLRDYVDGWNRKGRFQECLMVYGRADQPCRDCGTEIRKIKLAGRTTCWCPACQL